MKSIGPVIVGLLLVGVLGWEACQGPSRSEWAVDTARTFQGVEARERVADSLKAYAESLVAVAEYRDSLALLTERKGRAAYRSAMNLRDSLESVAIPDTCLPLALGWRRAHDSLLVAHQSTQGAFDSLAASQEPLRRSNTALLWAVRLKQESIDSLTALVRRAPEECRLLLIPCPRVFVGVGLTESGGTIRVGPTVGVGVRVPF